MKRRLKRKLKKRLKRKKRKKRRKKKKDQYIYHLEDNPYFNKDGIIQTKQVHQKKKTQKNDHNEFRNSLKARLQAITHRNRP